MLIPHLEVAGDENDDASGSPSLDVDTLKFGGHSPLSTILVHKFNVSVSSLDKTWDERCLLWGFPPIDTDLDRFLSFSFARAAANSVADFKFDLLT